MTFPHLIPLNTFSDILVLILLHKDDLGRISLIFTVLFGYFVLFLLQGIFFMSIVLEIRQCHKFSIIVYSNLVNEDFPKL